MFGLAGLRGRPDESGNIGNDKRVNRVAIAILADFSGLFRKVVEILHGRSGVANGP